MSKYVSYLPSRQEIVAERTLVDTPIAKKIRPAAVTISRSCVSGYCPREYVGFVEEELKQALMEGFRSAYPTRTSRNQEVNIRIRLKIPQGVRVQGLFLINSIHFA